MLDFDVLAAFCASKSTALSRADYDAIMTDIGSQDLKAGQTTSQLKVLCAEGQKTNNDFMKALAAYVQGTSAHGELRTAIFPEYLANVVAAPIAVATPETGSYVSEIGVPTETAP